MSEDDDKINADAQQQPDGVLHRNDASLIPPNYAKNILDDMAGSINRFKLQVQTSDGFYLKPKPIAKIDPQCGESLARLIFPALHSGKMLDANTLTTTYVEDKIHHDLQNFLEAYTPATGYDKESLQSAVQSFSQWFRSSRYQAHLSAYQDLAMLALEPIVLKGSFQVPRQYAALDYSAFDNPKFSPKDPVAPDLLRMDVVGGDVKDLPNLANQSPASSDASEPREELETIPFEDVGVVSDDRPQHIPIIVPKTIRRAAGLLTEDDELEEDAQEEDVEAAHDQHQWAAEAAADEAELEAMEGQQGAADGRLNMLDRLQMEGVKLGPAQEANIRLTQMIHYIDTHRDALFMPMQSHHHLQLDAEELGLAKPPYRFITKEDHNTPDHLPDKIEALKKAAGTLNHFARQSVFGPNADKIYRYNDAEARGMMPGMAFSRTLMTMAEYALEPRYSADLLADHFSARYLIHEARVNVRDTRNIGMEEPELVYSEAEVKHGGAIGSADAVGLGAGAKMVKQ